MIFFGVKVAFITTALGFWVHSYWLTRKPGVRAMCVALVLLEAAVLLGEFEKLDPNFGPPAFLDLVQHLCVLFSAYWLQVFCFHLTGPAEQVRSRARLRMTLLLTSTIGVVVSYVLAHLGHSVSDQGAAAESQPWTTTYLALYGGYLGLAMVDTFWMSRLAAHVHRRFLRLGLRLLGAGSLFGLLYVLHRLAYSGARAIGTPLPWPERGVLGPHTWLLTIAIVLLMSGVMAPPLGARWDARRAVAGLEPLWKAVTNIAPELVFKGGRDRLRVQITEIRDVLIGPLHQYLDPEVRERTLRQAEIAELPAEEAEAVADAAVIAVALEAKRRNIPLTQTPVIIGANDEADDVAESDHFVRIAKAFVRSRQVCTAVEEFTNRHGQVRH